MTQVVPRLQGPRLYPTRVMAGGRRCLLAAALVLGGPSVRGQAQPAPQVRDERPFTVEPTGRLHFDAGVVLEGARALGFGHRARVRRARVGLDGQFGPDWRYKVKLDLTDVHERVQLQDLSLRYAGADPVSVVLGAFRPRYTLEGSQSSNHILFLERSAVVNAAAGLAAGSSRLGGGIEGHGRQWFGALYLTAGRASETGDTQERGAVARGAIAPVLEDGRTVHVGVSTSWAARPTLSGERQIRLRGRPDLDLDSDRPVSTGRLPANSAHGVGLELGAVQGRWWAQGEYHRMVVQRSDSASRVGFDGWYGQVAYLIHGRPRIWRTSKGAWGPVGVAAGSGSRGALEMGLRYGVLDLEAHDVRGGRQALWTLGLNWYASDRVRVMLQVQQGHIAPGDDAARVNFKAVAVRGQLSF